MSAFGNGEVFLEKFIERPRHIEVQIMGEVQYLSFVYFQIKNVAFIEAAVIVQVLNCRLIARLQYKIWTIETNLYQGYGATTNY